MKVTQRAGPRPFDRNAVEGNQAQGCGGDRSDVSRYVGEWDLYLCDDAGGRCPDGRLRIRSDGTHDFSRIAGDDCAPAQGTHVILRDGRLSGSLPASPDGHQRILARTVDGMIDLDLVDLRQDPPGVISFLGVRAWRPDPEFHMRSR